MAERSEPPVQARTVPPSARFERLDTLVHVTSAHAWVSLGALFALSAAALIFAVVYRVPRKVIGEGILLIKKDRLTQVRTLGAGRLATLKVTLGQEVRLGDEIGTIHQDDLRDGIDEAEARVGALEQEDVLLTDFEDKERETQTAAVNRLKAAIARTVKNSRSGLDVADRIVGGSLRLRAMKQLNDFDYLKDLQQHYAIENDLNHGESRLEELQLTLLTAENQRQKARLQRQLEIKKLQTKLDVDRKKLDRTSRIVAHVEGRVAQVLTAVDELVREGSPVVLLSSPRNDAEPGTDDGASAYESIVFVPAGEGKKIDPGNAVEVMPATAKREEHGFIHGEVVAVSELPATRLAMEAALQHPDLVETFLKRYAPGVLLRLQVHLLPRDPARAVPHAESGEGKGEGNDYWWSSASGATLTLKSGTLCEAAVVVKRERLIALVFPWIKKSLGIFY